MRLTPPSIPASYSLANCKDRFSNLLDNWPNEELDFDNQPIPWPRREQIQGWKSAMFDRFCYAPASHKHAYHGAFPGGLLIHSTMIYDHMCSLLRTWNNIDRFIPSVALLAYFHDLGKVGDAYADLHIPQDNDWRLKNLGESYKFNEDQDFVKMHHELRSIHVLQFFGIPLLPYETQAIYFHSLSWNKAIESCWGEEHMLTLALHFADVWVARIYHI